MKLSNINGFSTIDGYVKDKLARYSLEEKSFKSLFKFMFEQTDNIMAEHTDGYRIRKTTYGAVKEKIISITPAVKGALMDAEADSIIGLYMANSLEWIEIFWAILASGYKPLLMNCRLPDEVLEGVIRDHNVAAVISDGKMFSKKTVLATDLLKDGGAEPLPCGDFGTEVIFMSSGTTDKVKLCAYTGENFYYQICDSVSVIEKCPKIKVHYEGELKQLALLPFYHVFGFIAVYLWFSFFSRTFVFPKDLNPATIQNTVKKHKVTHIFAVPMVWEAVHKAVLSKVKAKGEKTYRKFTRAIGIVNKLGSCGDLIAKKLLSEVREGLFGDSVQFLITGGSHINPETIRFFNGIGYHLANGYGMTEIGITSVEFSSSKKILNKAAIGAPFGYTEYSINEKGVLLVRGKTMASRIVSGGGESITDFDSWFETNDFARLCGGRFYLEGRADDLIVSESGENLNPTIAEAAIKASGIDRLCIFADSKNSPVLLISTPGCFSKTDLERIHGEVIACLKAAKLESVIKDIFFTPEPLLSGNDFKVSRRKIAKRYASGELKLFDPKFLDKHIDEMLSSLEREVAELFAEALGRDADGIGAEDGFFTTLGGNSLDYFTLLSLIKSRYGVDIAMTQQLSTIKEICEFIKK